MIHPLNLLWIVPLSASVGAIYMGLVVGGKR